MSLEKPRYLKPAYPQFEIGPNSYGGVQIGGFGEGMTCKIGDYCSFAIDTLILLGGNHRIDWVTTYPFSRIWAEAEHIEGHPRSNGDVVIGSDVWVGARSIILSGVTVGHGAVVAANSVVTHDVAPYQIVRGNPAKSLKYRFQNQIVLSLLEIAWWNWPRERIARALPEMLNSNVENFIDHVKEGRL